MRYIGRDGSGNVVNIAAAFIAGHCEEEVANDHADVVAFMQARALAMTPLERAKREAANNPLIVAIVKVLADLHAETPAQMRQRIVDKLV